jgi:hypothetical protein
MARQVIDNPSSAGIIHKNIAWQQSFSNFPIFRDRAWTAVDAANPESRCGSAKGLLKLL